jgi:murein L,D-transpeptidase YcbB/YkuD
MHDTPAKALFSRARRDFSHGCMRLENAQGLAEWVLREESGWRQDRIVAAMQGTESVSVKLTRLIPVMTIYVTAVVADNGEVHFFEDIYGQDAALEQELADAELEAQATSVEPGLRPRE